MRPANADLLLPYFAPYAAYVLVAAFAGDLPREVDYTVRIALTAALLWFFRERYQRLRGPRSTLGSVLVGALAGTLAAFVWAGLLVPFQDRSAGDPLELVPFLFRITAATLVVPFVEELLCRGYIQGLVTQWQEARRAGAKAPFHEAFEKRSVHQLASGAWTALAVALSAVAFAMGHSPAQWLAAFGYGVVMSGLWIWRGDLVAPITAHAVTNLVLYLYVYITGSWWLW